MQRATHHPPSPSPTHLPWPEQLLIRLDEIVGLLDSMATRLDRLLAQAEPPLHLEHNDFLDLLIQASQEPEP